MSDDIMAFLDAKFGKPETKKNNKQVKIHQPPAKSRSLKKIDNILSSSLKDF